jgi:hypothetical protein
MRPVVSFQPLIPSLADEVIERAGCGRALGRMGIAQSYHQACNDMAMAAVVGEAAVAMAGILPVWPGRASAWAIIAHDAIPLRCWPAITDKVLWMLGQAHMRGYRRIEATVDPEHPAACRWIRRLGFEAYGLLEAYTPDSRDLIGVCRLDPPVSPPAGPPVSPQAARERPHDRR